MTAGHPPANPHCLVRQAELRDLDVIVEFNCAMCQETEGCKLDPDRVRAGTQAALSDTAKGVYFVAEMDGQIVGQAQVTYEWSDWRNGLFWWIQSVYSRATHRRKGVFRALYTHITETAQHRGNVCGLRLYVERENEIAIGTYTRLGMKRTRYLMYEHDWSPEQGPG